MNADKAAVFLLPMDGSEHSARAARYCAWLARVSGGRVVVLHVQPEIDDLTIQAIGRETLRKHREENSRGATASALEALNGLPHEVVLAEGDPSQAIAATAEKHGCTHVVMGSHGLGRVSGIFMGSIAMKTFHLVKLPITYIP